MILAVLFANAEGNILIERCSLSLIHSFTREGKSLAEAAMQMTMEKTLSCSMSFFYVSLDAGQICSLLQ
jgi:hypothetical protein